MILLLGSIQLGRPPFPSPSLEVKESRPPKEVRERKHPRNDKFVSISYTLFLLGLK